MMIRLSTREAAKKLGISYGTLANYVKVGKVTSPETAKHGERIVHTWTEEEIEHVRKLLPRIANGRKTRYSKLREKQTAQMKAPVPHKKRKLKKKKRTTKPPKANG
jgi:predicted DNA-binding transcriptional regulator AlpA